VQISVADTGMGIPNEHLPYLFQRFWQGDTTVSREQGGLGIGLALARHLVEMHGGTIAVESGGLGTGAKFTITLPTADAAARENTLRASQVQRR
jgi:signal transduction histidine kinase